MIDKLLAKICIRVLLIRYNTFRSSIHSIHPRSSSMLYELITLWMRRISRLTALTFVSTRPLNSGSLSLSSAIFSSLMRSRVFVMTIRCVAMVVWILSWRLSAKVSNPALRFICSDSTTVSSASLLLMISFRLWSLPPPVALSAHQLRRKDHCDNLYYLSLYCIRHTNFPWVVR